MSETKYTPGPWALSDRGTTTVRTSDQRRRICYMEKADVTSDEQEWANARLIAAAPDLLGALEDVLSDYSAFIQDHGGTNSNALDRLYAARATLAKARGQTND